MSDPHPPAHQLLDDLATVVQRMHLLSTHPMVVLAAGTRTDGAPPMAWQVLFERTVHAAPRTLVYRGVGAAELPRVLRQGYDRDPQLGETWAHPRLGRAMADGPVIQAFRADRLPDDVARALVGVLVFEEDGLTRASVAAASGAPR